jgi:hypothetical protein
VGLLLWLLVMVAALAAGGEVVCWLMDFSSARPATT